jgi:FkbM family methyltransferase
MVARILLNFTKRIQIFLLPTIQDREIKRWYADDAENTKRLSFELNESSNVIDLGGYEGQWAEEIFQRNSSNIYVFEGIPLYADRIYNRFKQNRKITVFPLAVGCNSRTARMKLDGVGSSLVVGGGDVDVLVEDAGRLFDLCGITHCNLIKINIEGGEYEVLPRLIETGLIKRIDNILIQFHKIGSGYQKNMKEIQDKLSETHEPTWQYTWVWENWRLKMLKNNESSIVPF